MAPEQARGEAHCGPAVDTYALGVILYELLTGRVPFDGDSGVEILQKVQDEDPAPPTHWRSAVPPDLETICLKCLRKEAAQRYESALALAEDLGRWRRGEPIAARPVGRLERVVKWTRRRPALAGLAAVSALLLAAVLVMPSVAALRLQQERERTRSAERQRRRDLVRAVQSARPDSLPWILEALSAARDEAVPLLRDQLATATDDDHRRRSAIALALLGEPRVELLSDLAAATPAAYSHSMALAVTKLPRDEALAALRGRAGADADLVHRARYAILLLELVDVGLARELLRESPDPAARATFLEEFPTWHGPLEGLPELLRASRDPDFRSGLCAAVGGVDPADLRVQTREALTDELRRLHLEAEDGGTHAASGWALRRWGVSPPVAVGAARGGDRGWFANSLGMTLVRIPPGTLLAPDGLHVLDRPYFLGDREVTIAQFRAFLAEAGSAGDERPAPWTGPHAGWDGDERVPVHNISRDQAFQFCNWLSRREGRQPCYRRPDAGGRWLCDPGSDGYRLPTEAEWDYANRCRSTTTFPFGEQPRWLPQYASVGLMNPVAGGGHLPNRWGLFDMVGNLWEACWNRSRPLIPGVSATPGDGSDAGPEMARGGASSSGLFDCRSNYRVPAGWGEDALTFRVMCRD
jgi:formylglycine-generating enzyme required for sulfatase activity